MISMNTTDKPLVWLHGEVKTPPLSHAARIEAGFLLRRLQSGESLGMPQSRPMPAIGPRCHELRISDARAIWRIIYRIDADAVVLVEVFSKKVRLRPGRSLTPARRGSGSMTMREEKRKRLEAAYIELRLKLADGLRERRRRRHLTQVQLARMVRSSQSRVAKMEAGDPSVTLDLLIRSLLALGASDHDLARIITR